MPTWIAFQRAVNVGGRAYPMADLRAVLAEAGYQDVATHIQTGNIRLTSPTRSSAKVEAALEKLFEADRGFEVATIVLAPAELSEIAAQAGEIVAEYGEPGFGHYIELMRSEPSAADRALIEEPRDPGLRVVVRGRAAHLLSNIAFHELKPAPAAVRRAYGVSTNRNVTVIRALVEKWC